jgi:hypothetical protein
LKGFILLSPLKVENCSGAMYRIVPALKLIFSIFYSPRSTDTPKSAKTNFIGS